MNFENFNNIIGRFKQETSRAVTLQQFMFIHILYGNLKAELEGMINEVETSDVDDNIGAYLLHLDQLYLNALLAFIRFVQCSTQPQSILFADVQLIPNAIKKRHHLLQKMFHPDKIGLQMNNEQIKSEINDFSSLINTYNDRLSYTLDTKDADFFEQKGGALFKIANDYRKCSMQKWNELKTLNKDDLPIFTPKEFQSKATYFGLLAFEEFKQACKIADHKCNFTLQFRYRKSMVLCLYISEKRLEAELLLISLYNLIEDPKREDFYYVEAQQLYKKIKGIDDSSEQTSYNTNNNQTSKDLISFESRNANLKKISSELFLTPKSSIARLNAPESEIMQIKTGAAKAKAQAAGLAVAGVASAAVISAAEFFEVYSVYTVSSMLLGGPTVVIAASVLTLAFSSLGVKYLWDKSKKIGEEPEIRENLNGILKEFRIAYNANEYEKGLEELSKPFKDLQNEQTKENEKISILKFNEKKEFLFYPNESMKHLIQHGVSPDGVAYLYVLIANMLASGKIKTTNLSPTQVKNSACSILECLSSDILEKKAKQLDENVGKYRRMFIRYCKTMRKTTLDIIQAIGTKLFSEEYRNDFVPEHVEDSIKIGSILSRLKAIQLIAKLNYAIFTFTTDGSTAKDVIKKKIQEIKATLCTDELPLDWDHETYLRLDILDLYLWVVEKDYESQARSHGNNLNCAITETLIENEFVIVPDANIYSDEEVIHNITQDLKREKVIEKKIELILKKGDLQFKIASTYKKDDKIMSLKNFQIARNSFLEAYYFDQNNKLASLGALKCFVELSHFSKALTFFDKNEQMKKVLEESVPEYWLYTSIAWRKSIIKENHLTLADHCISEFLSYKPNQPMGIQQKKIVRNLSENKIEDKIIAYKKVKSIITNMDNTLQAKQKSEELFKIISIDGGGVRGVIPTLLLCEIERKAHRPLASMVDMFAGTSTGAIIGAGLSIPNNIISANPKYFASDLLELYISRSSDIFQSRRNVVASLFAEKYSNQCLHRLLEEYFGNQTIDNSLTDLLIPAVQHDNFNLTHCFTKRSAKRSPIYNISYVNAIMASTAAPSFFPSYKIENFGTYLDGGVTCNNPSRRAYEEAINFGKDKNNIFILSLGTGDCIPDPVDPEKTKGKMFWAKNLHELIMSSQDYETQKSMRSLLGEKWHRWQVYLEEPIALDGYEYMNQLLEIGSQYIEELNCSDERPIDKVVEILNPYV